MSRGERIEWAAILLATLSLIPWGFRYRPSWYWGVLAISLAAMIIVAARRLRRVRSMGE